MRKNLILRNGGSQNPDRWLKEPRNNHAGKRSDIQHYGDGACERAECLLLPQASADGTAAVAAVPRKAGGICAGAAHAVVKGTAGRML